MDNEFKKFLASCEVDRLEGLDNQFHGMQEVQALKEQSLQLYEELLKILPGEYHKTLCAYDDLCYEIAVKKITYFYKEGLNDGLSLGEVLFRNRRNLEFNISVI